MKTKIIVALIIIAVGGWLVWNFNKDDGGNNALALDSFAQCLTENDATMYGADWCKYCQTEQKAFGKAFKYVNYVECPTNTKLCLDKGIDGYPTWIIGGKKLEGLQGLGKLAEETGCALPQPENPQP